MPASPHALHMLPRQNPRAFFLKKIGEREDQDQEKLKSFFFVGSQ
jgi:hypothetical protein